MVESPKTGRELEGQRIQKGPEWLSRLVQKYFAPRSGDD